MLGVTMAVNRAASSIISRDNPQEVRSHLGVVKAPAKSHLVVEKVEAKIWMCKTMDPFSHFLLLPFNSRVFLWALLCHLLLDLLLHGTRRLLPRGCPIRLWG